jgi:hypothetical protein
MNALHNIELVQTTLDAQVLICESIADFERVQKQLDSVKGHFIPATWLGGSDGIANADWSPLKGRGVVLLTSVGTTEHLKGALRGVDIGSLKAIRGTTDNWSIAGAPDDFSLLEHAKQNTEIIWPGRKAADVRASPEPTAPADAAQPAAPTPATASAPSKPDRQHLVNRHSGARTNDIDFTGLLEPVARQLIGDPNAKLSSPTELRFGAKGSLSVHLGKGVWHDHETGAGGGLLDLIVHKGEARDHADAARWLRQRSFSGQPVAPVVTRKSDNAANKLRRAQTDFADCDAATLENLYVARKQGREKGFSIEGLRTVSFPMTGWAHCSGRPMIGWLAVPAYAEIGNAGEVMAVQYIGPGKKEKLNSATPIKGHIFTVGTFAPGETTYVVEGIGHAWSLNAVTGRAAVVSFSAGHIEVVAAKVKAAGGIPVIVPDRGKEADAERIAARLGCSFAPLPEDLPDREDVNDLHLDRGAEAVQAVVDAAIQPPAPVAISSEPPEDWDGTGSMEAWLEAAHQPSAKPVLPPFVFTHVGGMLDHLKPIDWLIRGYLEADSLALMFSDPGVGKSFMAIDLACCIATGRQWHGKATSQGPVFIIAGEGHNGLARRFKAWEIANSTDLKDVPLYVSLKSAAFSNEDSAKAVSKAVRALALKVGQQPRLIVVDTVARNFGPGDENSTQEMGEFIANLDELKHEFKATVLLVHHSGHADKNRARGSMALKGALDAEYRLERDEGVIRFEATKMKDAEAPEPLSFRLDGVKLPLVDEDGNDVFGAAIRSTMHVPKAMVGKAGKGKNQNLGLEALKVLEAEHRARVEASGRDPGEALVKESDWRDRLAQEGIDRRRFPEVRRGLVEAHLIEALHGGYVRTM